MDGGAPASGTNTGFGLKATGGSLYLFYSPAAGAALASGLNYGLQAADFSLGRVPDGSTNWVLCVPTAGAVNIAASLGNPLNLSINEWLANPVPGEDDWFELHNPNAQPVDLSGLYLSDNLGTPTKHLIPPLSFIGAGAYGFTRFVADEKTALGSDHVNFKLSGSGEALAVSDASGVLIHGLAFGPQAEGVSEGRLPDGTSNIVRFPATPTPGEANYLPLTNLVVNEVLSAVLTNGPLEQAIELLNVSGAPLDISGWYLSNTKRYLNKYRVPANTILPAGGLAVFYQYQFYSDPHILSSFLLDAVRGDQVYVSQTDAEGNLNGYRIVQDFSAAQPDVSFGRYLNSAGQADFVAMSRRTFGADSPDTVVQFRQGTGLTNADPRVGPVVFSEIMYHPSDLPGPVDNVRDEFVELYNPSTSSVPLYDPAHSTNTWRVRGGVDFNFPPGVTLAPAHCLLVVSFDPVNDSNALAGFKAAYPQLPPDAALYGPYSGKLDNGGESIDLRKPGTPEPDFVPYIVVERIAYDDALPWDAAAEGTGFSLQRRGALAYGNEPTNWLAALPSPGMGPGTKEDSDGDGIPDWWMNQYFGHPTGQIEDSSMATQDRDGDGLSNRDEYLAGTHPIDAESLLRLEVRSDPLSPNTRFILSFQGMASKSYTIQSSDELSSLWGTLFSFDALPSDGLVQVTNQVPAGRLRRFYRLVTPSVPPESSLRLEIRTDALSPNTRFVLSFQGMASRSYTIQVLGSIAAGVVAADQL